MNCLFYPIIFFSSHIIVTAIYNDTDVNMTSVQGDTTNFTLDAYDSYNMKTYSDVSGTTVTTSKPVSVVYGAICTRIPSDVGTVFHMPETRLVYLYAQEDIVFKKKKKKNSLKMPLHR